MNEFETVVRDLRIASLIKTRIKNFHFRRDSFGVRGKIAVFGKHLTNTIQPLDFCRFQG